MTVVDDRSDTSPRDESEWLMRYERALEDAGTPTFERSTGGRDCGVPNPADIDGDGE